MTAQAETRAPAGRERQAVRPGARRRRLGRALLYVAAVLLSLWVLVPLYLITVTAFTPRDHIFDFPKPVVPTHLSGETVDFFARSSGVLSALGASVLVALITLAISTALGAPAGYALARYAFRGRAAYRLAILSTRAFPIVILAIPLAVTFLTWGVFDTLIGVALMHTALALPFTVLVTSSVFVSVPKELEEAAQTLGCTPFGAFARIVLPMALPGLAAAGIFTWELSWNEVFAASILTLRHQTLPAHVLAVLNESPLPFRFAGGFFMLAPSLIVIFVIRKYVFNMWGRVVR